MLRLTLSFALLGILLACGSPRPGYGGPGPAAETMRLTAYSDGLSCPGGCDAHVVFHPRHDGTRYAFAPGQTLLANRATAIQHPCGGTGAPDGGRACVICFDESDASCLLVTHRGSGPPAGRFDVTAAFLVAHCDASTLPGPLAASCADFRLAEAALAARRNCIAEPTLAACQAVMRAAEADKAADLPRYAACLAAGGDAAYNARVTDPALHRAFDCAYFANQRNAAGRRLAPGACPAGSFVGQDGYDCCAGVAALDAIDPRECGLYYRAAD